MKFQTDALQARPEFDVGLNSPAADLRMISGLDQSPAKDIELISELVDQQAPSRRSPEPLIKVPDLIITPDLQAIEWNGFEAGPELVKAGEDAALGEVADVGQRGRI